jgi:hypothetical protein
LNINEFLDDNYKLTNNLDEKFDKLKCMDGITFKIVMPDKTTFIWMKVTKRMKYLDEHGT